MLKKKVSLSLGLFVIIASMVFTGCDWWGNDGEEPPTNLRYSTSNANYQVGEAISDNSPSVDGDVDSYEVVPALPDGLSMDATTGVISGTPSTVQSSANYIITATNAFGSTTATIQITVSEVVEEQGVYRCEPSYLGNVGCLDMLEKNGWTQDSANAYCDESDDTGNPPSAVLVSMDESCANTVDQAVLVKRCETCTSGDYDGSDRSSCSLPGYLYLTSGFPNAVCTMFINGMGVADAPWPAY